MVCRGEVGLGLAAESGPRSHRELLPADPLSPFCPRLGLRFRLTFVQANLDRSAPLWPEVRDELRQVAGFVFLCEVELAAPASEVAFCGDSSTDGYALHAARLRPSEFLEATAVKERWRFTIVETAWSGSEDRHSRVVCRPWSGFWPPGRLAGSGFQLSPSRAPARSPCSGVP